MTDDDLARIAHQAYAARTNSVKSWDHLDGFTKTIWREVAKAVIDAATPELVKGVTEAVRETLEAMDRYHS